MIAFQLWSRTDWRDHSPLVDSGGDAVKPKDAAPSQRENFLLQQGADRTSVAGGSGARKPAALLRSRDIPLLLPHPALLKTVSPPFYGPIETLPERGDGAPAGFSLEA